ncbi:putative membrane protein [Mumia flava]|uniref:Putative membrane protein n=1 Tax=Mumia flava TaxID=1348852 RepID=A0A0B2BL66_9ACTN|nr:hypothetical protein [Mumia flava]PJJ56282.1 putative membrane protein [Mumia flava]
MPGSSVRPSGRPPRDVTALAGLLAVAGVAHFVAPKPFESIVPRALPARRALVHASGVAELACAAGLVAPRTRRAAGYATAALMVAVFPANVQMTVTALRSPRASTGYRAATIARLPLQWPLVRTAWKAARSG